MWRAGRDLSQKRASRSDRRSASLLSYRTRHAYGRTIRSRFAPKNLEMQRIVWTVVEICHECLFVQLLKMQIKTGWCRKCFLIQSIAFSLLALWSNAKDVYSRRLLQVKGERHNIENVQENKTIYLEHPVSMFGKDISAALFAHAFTNSKLENDPLLENAQHTHMNYLDEK